MTSITFAGASGEVTGSSFYVKSDKHNYLVDCGIFQGHNKSGLNSEPFIYDPKSIDAVIITHAHMDHIGRLPKLVKDGYNGDIYMTSATAELGKIVLKDAYNVMVSNAQRNQEDPFYDEQDVNRALALVKTVPYYQRHTLMDGDGFVLYDAGHILGSSSALLDVDGKKIVFSGDIGHWPEPLLPAPSPPPSADIVVMEATYGGRDHPNQDRMSVLKDALDWTMEKKGVLLIPAFALERSQELLYLFHRLFEKYKYPRLPIFLDSPMAIDALDVFYKHEELFSKEVKERCADLHDIFSTRGLALASTVAESKEINDEPPPKVIIAGSGMMEGGRIAYHLRRYLPNPNTYLLIVGFQAGGTLGKEIQSGVTNVRIMDSMTTIRAKVVSVENFSSHADNDELLDWVEGINGVKKLCIVHSDPECAINFLKEIEQGRPKITAEIAKYGETLEL